jgi:hypothetical protein
MSQQGRRDSRSIRLTDILPRWEKEAGIARETIANSIAKALVGASEPRSSDAWIGGHLGARERGASRRVVPLADLHAFFRGSRMLLGVYPNGYSPALVWISVEWLSRSLSAAEIGAPEFLGGAKEQPASAAETRRHAAIAAVDEIIALATADGQNIDRKAMPGRWADLIKAVRALAPSIAHVTDTTIQEEYLDPAGIRFVQGAGNTDLYDKLVVGRGNSTRQTVDRRPRTGRGNKRSP